MNGLLSKGTIKHQAIILILALLCLLTLVAPVSANSRGDLNNDGLVNIQDVRIALSHVLGHEELSAEKLKLADLNNDNVVDIQDVNLMVKKSLGAVYTSHQKAIEERMVVHFINVHQGNSVLIQTPEQNILIDGGNRCGSALNYLNSKGINTLDLIIATKPHEDCIGGLLSVMQSIDVKEIIDPGYYVATDTYKEYLNLIEKNNIKFSVGRVYRTKDLGGGAELLLLHPASSANPQLNRSSIAARVSLGQTSFLFMEANDRAVERQLLSRGYNLKSTILKVGFNNQGESISQALINAIQPEAIVLMCGSAYVHSQGYERILNGLEQVNLNIYRADTQANMVIATDGYNYQANKEPYKYAVIETPPPVIEEPEPDIEEPEPDVEEPLIDIEEPPIDIEEPEPEKDIVPDPPSPSPVTARYVGSVKQDVFHYSTCGHVKKILSQNFRVYNSRQHAISLGKRPCKDCNP